MLEILKLIPIDVETIHLTFTFKIQLMGQVRLHLLKDVDQQYKIKSKNLIQGLDSIFLC